MSSRDEPVAVLVVPADPAYGELIAAFLQVMTLRRLSTHCDNHGNNEQMAVAW